MTPLEVQALRELFGDDSPTAAYRHRLKVDFYTNKDKTYLGATAKKAVAEALEKTLVENKDGSLTAEALENLKSAFIANFVTTLRLYKIVNTGLQLDLTFIPEANKKSDLDEEFENNNLIRLDKVGGLSAEWKKLESGSYLDSIYRNSASVPVKKKSDYIGGTISFYVEILDATPGFGRPSKNAVKGFMRYRRYYRMNRAFAAKRECQKLVLGAQPRNSGPSFFTVDIYKNFNLANLMPVTENLEIFPGYLVATGEGRTELAAFGNKGVGKTVRTTNFIVQDKSPRSVGSFYLKKLSYSLAEKRWDLAGSEIGPVTLQGDTSRALYEGRVKLFKQCESSLPGYLNLTDLGAGL